MRLSATIGIGFLGVLVALPYLVIDPPLKVGQPPPGGAHLARRDLSQPAEAGRRVFAGDCADCHGAAGQGGAAPPIDGMELARDFMHVRDLHEAVGRPVPGHEEMLRDAWNGDGTRRFNDIELVGKYLREIGHGRHRDRE